MNLLSSLNAGFSAAANGHVEIYIRGTNTRATVYGDFEASTSDSSGADIALDAQGSALVYVNQLVDVRVYDEDDVLIKDFCDGYSAPNIEVISPAFTGTDYVTALSAVNEPTTLQAVLDLWETNSGAPDWKVDVDGTATTLINAIGALSGLVFNVKSPAYGAVGDGVTNDQAAIQAALAAAVAAGGGTVYLPPGTYKIATAIEWSHFVNLVGAGADVSTISQSSAINSKILTWTSGTAKSAPVLIGGVSFSSSQVNNAEQLYASGIPINFRVVGCVFGSANSTGNLVRVASGGRVMFEACWLSANGGGLAAYLNADVSIIGCKFTTTSTGYNQELVRLTAGSYSFVCCEFDVSAVTSAPTDLHGIKVTDAATSLSVVGCSFTASTQAFNSCIQLMGSGAAFTAGNFFGSQERYSIISPPLRDGSQLELAGNVRVASAATAFTVADGVRVATYRLTGTVPTIALPTILFPGQQLTVMIENQGGGAFGANVTWTGGTFYGSAPTTTAGVGNAVFCDWTVAGLSSSTMQWIMQSCKIGSA